MTSPEPAPTPAADATPAPRYLLGRRPAPADELRDLARVAAEHGDEWDLYGEGGLVGVLEGRVAELLAKEDAALFPSGIMAQQCALRVWADRRGSRRVALPDLSHLLVHEEGGPALVHGLEMVPLTRGPRTPVAADVEAVPGHLAAVLVELPLRDAGYLLPTWEELEGVAAACRERAVPLHLDGARIWESQPRLGRSLAEIASLAQTVYVSIYKGLGGPCGALLAGDRDVVGEARLWRRRLGGTVYSLAAEAAGGLRGIDERLASMPRLWEAAQELAAGLAAAGLRVVPDVPHTNAFRLFAPVTPDEARARLDAHRDATGEVLLRGLRASEVPGWSWTEVTVTEATLAWDLPEAARTLARVLLGQGGPGSGA